MPTELQFLEKDDAGRLTQSECPVLVTLPDRGEEPDVDPVSDAQRAEGLALALLVAIDSRNLATMGRKLLILSDALGVRRWKNRTELADAAGCTLQSLSVLTKRTIEDFKHQGRERFSKTNVKCEP